MLSKLANQLEEYQDARRNAFVTAMTINATGKQIGGIYGINIPREILWAADIVPINIYSIDNSNVATAEKVIDAANCSLIKASYGYAITDKCPLTHFADIIVADSICPNKLAMISKLADMKKLYVLPEIQDTKLLAAKYQHFTNYLEQEYNIKISDTKLVEVIQKTNAISKKTEELITFFMLHPNIISSDDLQNIVYGSQFVLDLDERYSKLENIIESIKNETKQNPLCDKTIIKRVLLSGAPMAGLREKIIKPLEKLDVTVAAFAFSCCEGENLCLADEGKDPYTALAQKYFPLAPLEKLTDLATKYWADAIININLQGCNTLPSSYKKSGLPYLTITTDYTNNDTKQVFDQLNSFINSL